MRKAIVSIILVITCITSSMAGYRNPIIPGFYPDPSVVRVGQDYYLVNSTFQFFPGVPLWHSRDLVHWEQLGNVLDRESQLPLKGANCWLGIYAPTIRYHEGRFYMITTNVGSGPGNFIVTADVPKGTPTDRIPELFRSGKLTWSDPIWLKQGGIDPSLLFEDGKCYMTSNPDVGIWICEIDPRTGEQLTESKRIWDGTGGRHPEAPHLYKKDGYYYLMIAEGGTEVGHMVTIARSRSPYGPYESNPDNPILFHWRKAAQSNPIQGTGHADLVEAHDGSWWMVNLAFRPTSGNNHHLGRETFLAPVEWNKEGWPVVNGNGTIDMDMNVRTLPSVTYPSLPEHQTFQGKMGPEWMYLCNPHMGNYSVKDGRLFLRAETGKSLDTEGETITFVARRQQHTDCCFGTEVTLLNKGIGYEAGLTVYATGSSHYDVYLTRKASGDIALCLRYRLNEVTHQEAEVILPRNCDSARIKVETTAEQYHFLCSTDNGETWASLGKISSRYISSECAGGFTGTVIGLFAVNPRHTLAPLSPTASFACFDYKSAEK